MKVTSIMPPEIDNKLAILDIEITNKMLSDFEPFELEDYRKVIAFIDEKYPDVHIPERWDLIDKLLFKE